MALFSKVSMVINFTTTPKDASQAVAHSGGFSEGFWCSGPIDATDVKIRAMCLGRARLLPMGASIRGIRIGQYDVVGNQMSPLGTASAKVSYPGNNSYSLNAPQDSLTIGWTTAGVGSTSRSHMRAWPDELAQTGEVSMDAVSQRFLTAYLNVVANNGWGWLGRDPTAPAAHVISMAGTNITVDRVPVGMGFGSAVRFVNVRDALGGPVSGRTTITAVVGRVVTVERSATVTKEGGLIRNDVIRFFPFNAGEPGRLSVKKVGSPSERYRGRRSKSRV